MRHSHAERGNDHRHRKSSGVWQIAFASRLAPTFAMHIPVGASLLAKNDDAVSGNRRRVEQGDVVMQLVLLRPGLLLATGNIQVIVK